MFTARVQMVHGFVVDQDVADHSRLVHTSYNKQSVLIIPNEQSSSGAHLVLAEDDFVQPLFAQVLGDPVKLLLCAVLGVLHRGSADEHLQPVLQHLPHRRQCAVHGLQTFEEALRGVAGERVLAQGDVVDAVFHEVRASAIESTSIVPHLLATEENHD